MLNASALLSGIAVRGRSLVPVALFGLTLPAFAVSAWSGKYADTLGSEIAAGLIAVVPTLPARENPVEFAENAECEQPFDVAPSARVAVFGSKPARHRLAPSAPRQGIRISSAQVLALAARRSMPSAIFVKASAQHPAGLMLGGVSTLGVGLQDGDILTEAAGQKATSVAQVVGIVLAARSRQASEISGRFYRGSVPFSLTVEQPYPRAPVPG